MHAIQEVLLLFVRVFFTFLKNGAVTWPRDVLSPWQTLQKLPNVCCYLARSDLFSGCKEFKLMKLLKISSRSWTFLFTITSHVRISFVQFSLLHIAKGKSRDAGVCDACLEKSTVPERLGIYNRLCVFQSLRRLACFLSKYFLLWKQNSKRR